MSQYLGQHFLKNKAKLRKIVDALELKDNDVVVEIGPGRGALTLPLFEKYKELNCKIIAIEKDKELANDLKEKFKDDKNIKIIEGDVLKILPNFPKSYILNSKSYKVVGNIPYYITGYLFRILGELEQKPSLIVLLIQKEVAERVCAKPPKMNLLAASIQIWAESEIIGYVEQKDFSPQPKVDSAIIKLLPRTNTDWTRTDADKYYQFIKVLFKQPRKTIINNLKSHSSAGGSNLKNKEEIVKKLQEMEIKENARPQDLNIEQIIKLSTLF